MKIVFRTNSGKEGLGHINRILSLLYGIYLKLKNIELFLILNKNSESYVKKFFRIYNIKKVKVFFKENYDEHDFELYSEINPDFIVLDSYIFDYKYIFNLSNFFKTIYIDDNNRFSNENLDLYALINGNIHANKIDYKNIIGEKLLGPRYLIINPKYWERNNINYDNTFDICITTGGADPLRTNKLFLERLHNRNLKIKSIIGPFYEEKYKNYLINNFKNVEYSIEPNNIFDDVASSQMILTPSSSSLYEILTLRKIPLVFVNFEDQEKIYNNLDFYNIKRIGKYNDFNFKIFDNLNFSIYNEKLKPTFNIFNGKGVERIIKKLFFKEG